MRGRVNSEHVEEERSVHADNESSSAPMTMTRTVHTAGLQGNGGG